MQGCGCAVKISSVCPRTSPKTQTHIDAFNVGLAVLEGGKVCVFYKPWQWTGRPRVRLRGSQNVIFTTSGETWHESHQYLNTGRPARGSRVPANFNGRPLVRLRGSQNVNPFCPIHNIKRDVTWTTPRLVVDVTSVARITALLLIVVTTVVLPVETVD